MARKVLIALCALLGWIVAGAAAAAQPVSAELQSRADQVVALLKGEADPAQMFAPSFLAQVPAAQVQAVSLQLRSQYGAVMGLNRIEPQSATAGVIHVDFERAAVRMTMALEADPPHRIQGLLVTGADVRGDSLSAIVEELRALPGQTSFAFARLGEGPPGLLASHEPDRPLAIGSSFKLFILAELSRQVKAGERRWSDVVTLDRRSLPSGTLQDWPEGSPVTLHTLAALMISVSDNTATDMLLHTLGRETVERMTATLGIAAPERNRPFLNTLEAFALKTAPEAAYQAWRSGGEAARRRILASDFASPDASAIDPSRFTGAPNRIDVEWFASANDLIRTMDWLRRDGDGPTRAILAINPGIGPAARELGYVGFKGGSEPGVINLTFLVRNRAGIWHAISGSWNNSEAALEEARFVGLMARAVQMAR